MKMLLDRQSPAEQIMLIHETEIVAFEISNGTTSYFYGSFEFHLGFRKTMKLFKTYIIYIIKLYTLIDRLPGSLLAKAAIKVLFPAPLKIDFIRIK